MTADLRTDVAADRAAVETEVRACFDAYEAALVGGDVAAVNEWFAEDPRTIRFGIADEQWGAAAVREWRRGAARVSPGRELVRTDVVMWTPEIAVVTTLFRYPGSALGRQSQTWLRCAAGWRIVHAHVSQRPGRASAPR